MRRVTMRSHVGALLASVALAIVPSSEMSGQTAGDQAGAHVAAAKAAAGQEHLAVFNLLCATPAPQNAAPAAPSSGPPDRSAWHAEPVKVFDNLYFVGQTEYSAWAVTTSAG